MRAGIFFLVGRLAGGLGRGHELGKEVPALGDGGSRTAPEAGWIAKTASLARRNVGVYFVRQMKRERHNSLEVICRRRRYETVDFMMRETRGKCCRSRSGMMSHDTTPVSRF